MMKVLWIVRVFYCLLLALYLVSWIQLALEGSYQEIVDDFLIIAFSTGLWASMEIYHRKKHKPQK